MAKAAPAFQIYPADYLASTSTFTDAESGVYSKLLFWSWLNGPLPLDSQRVRRAAQSSATDAEWEAIWAVVEPRWTKQPNGYVNDRLERTRKEQDDYRERQKGNGAKGGRPKTHSKPTDNPVVPFGETQTVTQTEPANNPSDLCSSPLISDLQPLPSPVESEHLAPPADISEILVIAPFDRTQDQNETLADYRGVTLLPRGTRPSRQSASIASREVTCRKHYGSGVLPSCAHGVCIPAFLGQSWESQCAADVDATAYVRAFIADVCRGMSGPIGDDPLTFWRAQWKAKHGSAIPERSAKFLSEANRALAMLEAKS